MNLPDKFKIKKDCAFGEMGKELKIGVHNCEHCIIVPTSVVKKKTQKRTVCYAYTIPLPVAFTMGEFFEPVYDGSFWNA